MGTKGTTRRLVGLPLSPQLPIILRVMESQRNLQSYVAKWQVTALGLHATLTGADESNTAKVGIGGDDGHDKRNDGD